MISAKDAFQLTTVYETNDLKHQENNVDVELNMNIIKSVKDCKYSYSFIGSLSKETKKMLTDNGYCVDISSTANERGNTSVIISWDLR